MNSRSDGQSSNDRIAQLEKLLREAVKIVHCHARNTDKDWLTRARAALRPPRTDSTSFSPNFDQRNGIR